MHAARRLMGLVLVAWAAVGVGAAPEGLHAPWDELLQAHVRGGQVDYPGMRQEEDKLDAYLAELAGVDLAAFSRDEQLALWINAYNAYTVRLILNHYPVKSIRDIPRPWKGWEWEVAGKKRTLDQIEHCVLRREFREPRIHFAINCASTGCPDLWDRAYRGGSIDRELDAAARRFIHSTKHVQTVKTRALFGREKSVLRLSAIFRWFGGDFTADGRQTVVDFVLRYADPATRDFIQAVGAKPTIEYLDYDWSLNQAPPPLRPDGPP